MELLIKRRWKKQDYTIGELWVDGKLFCNTLEDTCREGGVKLYGKTAIPANGKGFYNSAKAPEYYDVTLTWSPKFNRIMPLVTPVPCFTGIRFHWGGDASHTEGCVLVGWNTIVGKLTQSRATFDKLFDKMTYAVKKEKIKLRIE